MSAAVTPAIRRALTTLAPGPALLYDLGLVADRMTRARAAAHAAGVELLYAVKAFPVPAALALAAAHLDGLDLAGPDEHALTLALARPPTTVSVTYPGGVDAAALAALAARHRVTAVCETAGQLATAATVPGLDLAVRLAATADSRFGIAAADLAAVVAAAGPTAADRVRALHVHGGPLATHPARLAATARAAVAAAAAAGLALEQLDLGGSLHGFTLDRPTSGQFTLAAALAAARAEVPAGVRLLFEPGRLWTEGAGFAAGRVLAARDHGGVPVRVLELSRLAHLRWCTPRLVAPPPRAGEPRVRLRLLGATCCEDDDLADALIPPSHAPALAQGATAVLAGITGYAAAWNRGFAGVPAAHVVTV